MAYNALNQVTGADITTSSGATNVAYAYDHDGIRTGKTVNGTDVTRYLVDKNRAYAQVLEEQRSVSGFDTTTSYVYGDDLLSQSTGSIPHYFMYDGMGSVRGLTDTYSYDAYGNLLDMSGSTRNPYLYRGEQYDDTLEAYYLRARYYNMAIGRFNSADAFEGLITEPLSLHRYVYTRNNPVNNIDPSGYTDLPQLTVAMAIRGIITTIAIGQTAHSGLKILFHESADKLAQALKVSNLPIAVAFFKHSLSHFTCDVYLNNAFYHGQDSGSQEIFNVKTKLISDT